jgi:hypothetical protein
MSERRENSVLFSLKELRRIEDDRVKKESDEVRAKADAERAAKEASVRAARDAEERSRRDEEDRLRRIEEEKEAKVREDQMRLGEAERRARVEGEMRLQEERMRLEAQSRSHAKSPVKAVLGVAVVLVLVAGGLGYKMYGDHQAELVAARLKAADEAKATREADRVEFERRLAGITQEMNAKLANAKSEEERNRIRAEAAQARAQAQTRPSHHSTKSEAPTPPAVHKAATKKAVSDNPLEGL